MVWLFPCRARRRRATYLCSQRLSCEHTSYVAHRESERHSTCPQRLALRTDFMAAGLKLPPNCSIGWLVRKYGEKKLKI